MDNQKEADMYSIEKMMTVSESRIKDVEFYLSSVVEKRSNDAEVYAAAYVLLQFKKNKMVTMDELKDYIQNDLTDTRRLFISSALRNGYSFVEENINRFSEIELAAFILRFHGHGGLYSGEQGTPESISRLALQILQPAERETIADLGNGIGDFLIITAMECPDSKCYGVEINTTSVEIARIRTELVSNVFELEQKDMFELDGVRSFDKIFSNYPFGLKLKSQSLVSYLDKIQKEVPTIKNITSSDWLFNLLIVNCLGDNGKAVAVMTNGSTWNGIDRNIREYFVKKGYVEAIIALPPRMFEYSSISTSMIVLSKGNTAIRMVDARELCEVGRRQTVLTKENISEIVRLLSEDGDHSILVDNNVFADKEYVLYPARFMEQSVVIKNGVPFESIIRRITRGAQIRASEMDNLVSDVPTDNQYLMLANIQNGIIDDDLPYLRDLDTRLDRYLIKDKDLLLSKIGEPFKIAVAEVEDGRKVLGNGNLFIIELDTERANPYYIKAFFESEVGTSALKNIAVGSQIPNISSESLRRLTVPLPPIEEQNEFAQKYMAKIDEVKILQARLQKAMSSLKTMYEEE